MRAAAAAPQAPGKLRLGARDDAFEREADRVAEAVTRAGAGGTGIAGTLARTLPPPPPRPTVQRLCPECEKEQAGALQRKCAACAAEDDDQLQLKPEGGRGSVLSAPSAVPAGTAARIGGLRGGGEPLPPALRSYFEPRLGRDLAPVRLHTGPAAVAAAREVRARAFTVGPDIAFAPGEYDPGSGRGRRLLAHELVHTIQQGAAGEAAVIRRRPQDPLEDEIHQPMIEEYRRSIGLDPSGVDPQTGQVDSTSPGQIKYQSGRTGDVAAPAVPPSFPALPEAMSEVPCGQFIPGMTPAQRSALSECVFHARYVNVLNQAAADMARVASPFAPGLATLYQALVREVVRAGLATRPTATTPQVYSVANLTIPIGGGVTLPVPQFDLTLEQTRNAPNGARQGSGIELNEISQSALLGLHTDVERTMYHEGFHFLSGEVSSHNRQVRGGQLAGPTIRPELDAELVRGFQGDFTAAALPTWQRVLAAVPQIGGLNSPMTVPDLERIQWIKVVNEIVARVEEAVYLNLRQGLGFTSGADLAALRQDWLFTPEYWDSGAVFVRQDFEAFLTGPGRAAIESRLLPVVQRIQRAYLRQRPGP